MIAVNVESIAEVKVLTSSYQAEYGRSSGLQVTAVTKSGTNQFRGSLYDVERNSDWNANSKTTSSTAIRRRSLKQRDWGYSIGGPVGKPGGNNKLFFFYAQEFQPRTTGNNVVRFRVPTALERAGRLLADDRQQRQPVPVHQGSADRRRPCSATSDTAAASQDGGVLGRIPANRLYQTGPEHPQAVPAAEHRRRAGRSDLQLSRSPGRPRACSAGSRSSASTTSRSQSLRGDVQVPGVGAAERVDPRIDSRVQRHADERIRSCRSGRRR